MKFHQAGSSLSSFTAPDINMSRNSSQRWSQTTTRDGGDSREKRGSHCRGAMKMARNPVSSSRMSHWKLKKSRHTVERERYDAQRRIKAGRGATPITTRSENTAPPAQRKCRNESLALNQHIVGSHQ